MGLRERDKTDTTASEESRQAMSIETTPTAKESPNPTNRSPDVRRRALLAGLATTPVLLTLTNRSALGFNIDCSAFASLVSGGSPGGGLPPGAEHLPPDVLESQYRTQCLDGENGTGNASGNSGQTGNATNTPSGNASGNSNN
jgi:hypothetical protein